MSTSLLAGLPLPGCIPKVVTPGLPAQMLLSGGAPSPSVHIAMRRSSASGPCLGILVIGAVTACRQRLPQSRKAHIKFSFVSVGAAGARVVRSAAADDQEATDEENREAEAQLAALEAELEQMEDSLGDELNDLADAVGERQAKLSSSVDEILERAPAPRVSSITPGAGLDSNATVQRVAVCGFFSDSGAGVAGVGGRLLTRLREEGKAEPQMLDLRQLPSMAFEEVDRVLGGCVSAVICPETAAGGDEGKELEAALKGVKVAASSFPDKLNKVVLLSRSGAQDSKGGFNFGSLFDGNQGAKWADIEDELTSAARKRTGNNPLHVVLVRTGQMKEAAGAGTVVRCMPVDETSDASTSVNTAAEAIFQSLKLEADTGFTVVDDSGATSISPEWPELLLPFVGPEVWRTEVDSASRAAIFAQSWADEFFGQGKSAMRLGVKTPVQLQNTPSGVMFKFRPVSTLDEVPFEELEEGGVEFVAEEPAGMPPRLRIKRIGYGWKVSVKENSEKALVSRFKKDWAEVN